MVKVKRWHGLGVKRVSPQLCADPCQHLREDQEVALSWGWLANPPFVQHHSLVEE